MKQLLLFTFLLFSTISYAQLNCNGLLNISLDIIGEAHVDPEIYVEGSIEPYDSVWADRVFFNCDDIGDEISFQVFAIDYDNNNLIDSCTTSVLIADFTPPVAVSEADITVDISDGPFELTTEMLDDGSYDACGPITLELSDYFIDCSDPNPSIVTLTVTDLSGNTNQAFVNVTYTYIPDASAIICINDLDINVFLAPWELNVVELLAGGPSACPSDYVAQILESTTGGDIPSDNIFTEAHAGHSYTIEIIHFLTANSCWLTLNIVTAGGTYGFCVEDWEGNELKEVNILGQITDETGCTEILATPSMIITAEKDDDPKNGVDMIDLLLLRMHILGQITLNEEQVFSGDINRNGSLSTLDLVLLEKMLFDLYELDQSWYFYSGEVNNGNPPGEVLSEQIVIEAGVTDYVFNALKVGDVDLSYTQNVIPDDEKNKLSYTDIALQAGETYEISLYSKDVSNLYALDLGFMLETEDYLIEDVSSDLEGFVFTMMENTIGDIVKVLYASPDQYIEAGGNELAAGEAIVKIKIKAKQNSILSNSFDISDAGSNKWWSAFNNTGTEYLKLDVEGKLTVGFEDKELNEVSIYPNPVLNMIHIQSRENLDHNNYIIYNSRGKSIKNGQIRDNSIDVSGLNDGLYILQIDSNKNKVSLRFVVI